MLAVENLTKKFKDVTAVDNISFNAESGKIFGLLGPNGAGKTTTIRTILNILKPTSGSISFNNKPIDNEFFNLAGYLPEERGLYKKSKVFDTIIYFARLKKMGRMHASDEAKLWLEKLEVISLKDKRIEELSKGNQQKIQFICAVVHNPELLILDEPFGGFDPINQQLIKDILLSFIKHGKTIVLSTHQMDTAEKMCDDIFLINNGKKVLSGSVQLVKKSFGGNFVKIEYTGNGAFLNSHPLTIHVENYNNYAEVQLKKEVMPYDFLNSVVGKININHFSVIEPTLNKIFIDTIKQSSGDL